jgi:hypothetical protein
MRQAEEKADLHFGVVQDDRVLDAHTSMDLDMGTDAHIRAKLRRSGCRT